MLGCETFDKTPMTIGSTFQDSDGSYECRRLDNGNVKFVFAPGMRNYVYTYENSI